MSKVIYENRLASKEDIKDFELEGEAGISFENGAMRLENHANESGEQDFVLWCPQVMPADLKIEWEFRPIEEPGAAAFLFAAKVKDESLRAYQASYFMRKDSDEKAFHICDLRKGSELQLVVQGADPVPDASEDSPWYRMTVIKNRDKVAFYINSLKILEFDDDGQSFGDILTGGNIGFRQLGGLSAEYRNLVVTWL